MADPQAAMLQGVKHPHRPGRRKRISADVEPEVYISLSQRASAEGVPLSKLVRRLVWQFVGWPLPRGEVQPPRRPGRRQRIAVKVEPEVYSYLSQRAATEGVPLRKLVRELVLASLGAPLLPGGVKHHD